VEHGGFSGHRCSPAKESPNTAAHLGLRTSRKARVTSTAVSGLRDGAGSPTTIVPRSGETARVASDDRVCLDVDERARQLFQSRDSPTQKSRSKEVKTGSFPFSLEGRELEAESVVLDRDGRMTAEQEPCETTEEQDEGWHEPRFLVCIVLKVITDGLDIGNHKFDILDLVASSSSTRLRVVCLYQTEVTDAQRIRAAIPEGCHAVRPTNSPSTAPLASIPAAFSGLPSRHKGPVWSGQPLGQTTVQGLHR
jgi:hypothetical protein